MLATTSADGPLSIQEKIRIAEEAHSRWGETLRANTRITELLSAVKQRLAQSREAMSVCGLVEICRVCEEEEGGSCCGKGIENKFCPSLLLINLLVGQSLPAMALRDDSCYFLGSQGCRLQVRQVICVNYICQRIQKQIPRDQLIRLQTVIGEELEAVFTLQESIKRLVATSPVSSI